MNRFMTVKKQPVIKHEGPCPDGWSDRVHGDICWRTLFSSGQTPTEDLTAGLAEILPGNEFKSHRHEQSEIYYILSGSGSISIDGAVYKVAPGTAIFIPGNAIHSIRNTGSDALRFFYAFAVDSIDEIDYFFTEDPREQESRLHGDPG